MVHRCLILLALVLFLPFISAVATFTQPYNITSSCESFTCATLNVTVFYPNSTLAVDNKPMTSNGVYAYYSLTPSVFGDYSYILYDGGNYSSNTFTATGTGGNLNTGQAIIYLGLLALLIFFFIISVFGFSFMRGTHNVDNIGNVISLNYLKYLKSTLFVIAWGLLVIILFITSTLTANYFTENLSSIFFMLFRLSLILAVPIVILYALWVIINAFDDRKIKQLMDRGVTSRIA